MAVGHTRKDPEDEEAKATQMSMKKKTMKAAKENRLLVWCRSLGSGDGPRRRPRRAATSAPRPGAAPSPAPRRPRIAKPTARHTRPRQSGHYDSEPFCPTKTNTPSFILILFKFKLL